MNRRAPDMDHPDFQQQQQQGQYNRNRTSMNTMQPSFSSGGTAGFPDLTNELRRYSLSVAPGNTGMPIDQQQQMMQQQQQMMMQGQANFNAGAFRPDMAAAANNAVMAGNFSMGANEMAIAQRMQAGMGNTMFMGTNAASTFPTQRGSATGASGGDASGFMGAAGQSLHGATGSQADREEELLLNLLIARRQRGQMGDSPGQTQSLTDELARLRQQRAVVGPGMAAGYPDALQQQFAQVPVSEMNEGINRAPNRLLDARNQEMLDLSGRSMRRGFDFGGMMGPPQGLYGGMVAPDAMTQPSKKKKRTHKKKPADMPRRPLSAYNLFFSEERERILKEIEAKEGGDSSAAKGGEEGKSDDAAKKEGEREEKKPKALLRPLIPSQKKRRPHRKTHGKISFQQLARMVGERWKALDADRRKYYQDLANEDMKRQKAAMEDYYAKQNTEKHTEEKVVASEPSGSSGLSAKPEESAAV